MQIAIMLNKIFQIFSTTWFLLTNRLLDEKIKKCPSNSSTTKNNTNFRRPENMDNIKNLRIKLRCKSYTHGHLSEWERSSTPYYNGLKWALKPDFWRNTTLLVHLDNLNQKISILLNSPPDRLLHIYGNLSATASYTMLHKI